MIRMIFALSHLFFSTNTEDEISKINIRLINLNQYCRNVILNFSFFERRIWIVEENLSNDTIGFNKTFFNILYGGT
jgi:hypothetical protein